LYLALFYRFFLSLSVFSLLHLLRASIAVVFFFFGAAVMIFYISALGFNLYGYISALGFNLYGPLGLYLFRYLFLVRLGSRRAFEVLAGKEKPVHRGEDDHNANHDAGVVEGGR